MSKLKVFSVFILMIFFMASPNLSAQVVKDDFRVNDDTSGGESSFPDAVILEDGETVVVWRDGRDGVIYIYGQAYDSTGNIAGSNFKVSTYSGSTTESDPAIVSYGDSVLVVWYQRYGQWLLSDGSRSGLTFDMRSGPMSNLDVAVGGSGILAVWDYNVSGSGYEIFLNRFEFNGDSTGPRMILNTDGGSEDQRYAKIAMNKGGSAVVVWQDNRNGDGDIYGQRVNDLGNTIDTNFLISNDLGSDNQYEPACAMDQAGNFVVVWQDYRSGNPDIYGQRFDSTGSPIDTNFLINDEVGAYNQYEPECAMDSAGNFVVVWRDFRESDANIYGQIFDNTGATIGTNFKIDQSPGPEDDIFPEVSMNDSNIVVTWHRYYNMSVSYDVYQRRYENDGTPVGNEVKVNDISGTADQQDPRVDMNDAGNVIVIWEDFRNNQRVYFQRFDALGNTLGDNVGLGYGYRPDAAVSEDSSFVISYDFGNDIYYQRSRPSGDTIGVPIIISDTTAGGRNTPLMDIDSHNNVVVAWRDYRTGDNDIYAQMIDAAGDTVGRNFRVNDDPGTVEQTEQAIAMSPSGKFLIVWRDYRNGDSDIYGQIFNSDRTPVGSNFRIDSGGVFLQFSPDAGAFPDGNFIVVWADYRTPNGIYAQIVDSMGTLVDTNFKVSDHVYAYDASVTAAPSGAFVVTWEDFYSSETDIYAQKYTPDYSPDSINFKVNNGIEGVYTAQLDPCVATNGSSIIFTWRDPKWQRGYDIAAKVFGWTSGIEDVTQEGKGLKILGVSSPILTGKEWLSISLDSPSKVDFQIINVAGIVVSSKELTYTTPGVKRVEFSVSKLPSGPYFLSLLTDRGNAIKKTVVIR